MANNNNFKFKQWLARVRNLYIFSDYLNLYRFKVQIMRIAYNITHTYYVKYLFDYCGLKHSENDLPI